jgi:hypothetical protein
MCGLWELFHGFFECGLDRLLSGEYDVEDQWPRRIGEVKEGALVLDPNHALGPVCLQQKIAKHL